MKNILFIGPYRQRNLDGIWSRALAHNIINTASTNVRTRPIFIDYDSSISDLDAVLTAAEEQTVIDSIDTVIQHVPIDMASPIDAVKQNILIPILDPNIIPQYRITDTISRFDKILVDNKADALKIAQNYPILNPITKNIDYTFEISSNIKTRFNIGLLNKSTALYMALNYKQNSRLIYDIIVSFIANIEHHNKILALFMLDISVSEKQELENFINQAYKAMDMPYSINRVVVLPITSDTNNLYTAHATGDIFIDAIDTGSNSINLKIAQSLKKLIIKFDNNFIFSLTNNSNQISKLGSIKLSSQSINHSIRYYLENESIYQISSLFKTQHINKLL